MLRYAQHGKPEHLDALVNLIGNDLYHFLLSQTDPTLAADLCQSTWLKVIEKRQYYKTGGRFKSWLFTLGRNLMIDHLRQQNRWQTQELNDDELVSVELDESFSEQQSLAAFNQLLEALPFLQKEAFILQKEGFSLDEIAHITGDHVQTIKSRLRYAKKLFKSLTSHYQEDM